MLNKNILENKKVIIFDLDGTLVDSIGIWNKVDMATVKYFTGKEVEETEVNHLRDHVLRTATEEDIYRAYIKELCSKYNILEDIDTVYEKRKYFGDEIPKKDVTFKPFAKEVLLKLKDLGFILALATTSTTKKVEIYSFENINTNSINLFEIFDLILTKDEVVKKKPDPEVLNKIIDYFKIEKSEAIVFEDSLVGVRTANNAGIEVVSVYDKYADYERDIINENSDYKIDSFKEILDLL